MPHLTLLPRVACALFALLALFVLAPSPIPIQPLHAAGQIVFVAPGGAGAQSGVDWANAKDLQAALAAAATGDQIWIKQGSYKPTTTTDRAATFQLSSGVALYGGFSGVETALDQRDPAANVTILSGDLLGNDSGAVSWNNPTRNDNSYHVVTSSGTDATAVFDGFTVTAGNASVSPNGSGGGLFNVSGSPTIRHVIMSRNSAQGGGGMYNEQGSPSISYVTFSNNSVQFDGGGMQSYRGNLKLNHTSFSNNFADFGGGMSTMLSTSTLSHVSFNGNHASGWGGGMSNVGNAVFSYVSFIGNRADVRGGGLVSQGRLASITLSHAIFSGNTAVNGGGMANTGDNDLIISHASFSGNTATNGGGLENWTDDPAVYNSILWGNSGGQITTHTGTPDVQRTLVQGGYISGTNILTSDPLFVDADGADNLAGTTDDDLGLRSSSPAIDAGDEAFIASDQTDEDGDGNTAEPAPLDLDGHPRIAGTTVDLGPYEHMIRLTSAPPPESAYGESYSHHFSAVGLPPFTYSLMAGALPSGLELATNGQLSGTTTAAGVYTATVAVTNTFGVDSQTFSITVNRAPLTIRANDQIRRVGAPNPPLTASYSGFVNGDDLSKLTAPVALTTTAVLSSTVGSYPIYASGAEDPNYTISFESGTLTVTAKLMPVVTWANPAPLTYGMSLDATQLNATTNVPGTFSYTPAAGTILNAGDSQTLTAVFIPSDTDTYEIVPLRASIDVAKAPLTITAHNATKIAGTPNPSFSVSYSGFVLGETPTALSGALAFTTVATTNSSPGEYAITPRGLTSSNYTITFVDGILSIKARSFQVFLPAARR